ncbi:hypothetical protein BT69DRAFT_1294351 [Atractiella rhizophila]|nr:hypothetical protein BT69DRAFT_1294351 [Atractiella rhizophila]
MWELKFPLQLDQEPPLYDSTSHPKYCFGWKIPREVLQKYATEHFGNGNVENRVMEDLLPRWWAEAGLPKEQYGTSSQGRAYAMERVAYIATNSTPEGLERARDKDYVEAAKKALRVEGEPTWFYCDRSSRNFFVKFA